MSVEKVPSDPVDVLDLRFRQLRRIDLNSYNAKGQQFSDEKQKSLVAASSKYGLVFLGLGTNLVVLKTADIETLDVLSSKEQRKTDASDFPAQLAPLPSEALFISLSSDSLTLSVCCMRNGGCCVLFYDVRSFAKRDTTIGWFLEARLSSTTSVTVADFVWNPGQGNAYAYCLSDGTVGIAEVIETSLEIKATRPDMKASALSWSPKGKQIFVGTTTGQMIQCKPDLKEVKSVSPPPSLSAMHAICGILWISTNQVAAVYINPSDPDPLFHIINMRKNLPIEYINYDDICYGGGTDVAASFYNMQYIAEWGVILCISATAAEVAVLGREGTEDPPAWQQWNVDGSWRAELPFILKGDQTYPLGAMLDFSSQQRIPWGENETLDPMPLLYLLSTGRSLCPFQVISLKAGSPVLTHPPQPLSPEQARGSIVTLPVTPAIIQPQKTPSFGFGSVIAQASKPAPMAAPVQIKAPAAVLPAVPAPASIPAPAAFVSVAPPVPTSHPPFQNEVSLPGPPKNFTSVTANAESKAKAGSAAAILAFKQGVTAFEEELKAFKQRASKINAPIGTDAEKVQLIQQTASMQSFCSELVATTVVQENEIRNLKSSNLEAAAWLEEAKSRELRSKDEKYKHLLKLRRLDPASQRKRNEINRLRDYLTQQLQEAMRKQDQLLEDARRTPMSPKTWLPPSSELVYETLAWHEYLLGELSDRKEKIVAQLRILQKKRHALCLSYPGVASEKKSVLENGGSDLARLAESLLISHGRSSPASPSQSRYTQNALSPEKQAFIRDSLSHRPVRVIRTHIPSPTKPSRMLSTLTDDSKKELPKLRPDVQQTVPAKAAVNEIPTKPLLQAQQLPKQAEKSTFTNIAAAQPFSKPPEPSKPSEGLKIPTTSTLFKVPSSGGLNFLENKVAPNVSVPATSAPIFMKPLITEPPKEVPKPPTPVATFKIQAKEPPKTSASPSMLFQGTGFVLGSKTEEKPREITATQPKEEPKLKELPPLKPVSAPASTPSVFSGFGLVKSESSTSLATKLTSDSPALINITPVVQPQPTVPQTVIKPISTPAPAMNSPLSYATSTPQESAASSLGMIAALASSVDKEITSGIQPPRVSLSQAPPTTTEPTKSAFSVPSFTAGITSTPASKAFSFSLPASTTVSDTTTAPSAVPDRLFGGTTSGGLTITPVKVAATQSQPVSLFKAFGDNKPDQPTVTTAESQPTASKPFSSSSFTFALPGTATTSIASATTPTSSFFGNTAPVFGQASFGMPASTGGTAAGTGTTSIFGQSAFGMNKPSTAPVAPMTGGGIFGQSSFGAPKISEVTPTSVSAAPVASVFGQPSFGTPKTSDATTTSSVFGQPSFGVPKTSEATPTGTSSSLFGQNAFGMTSTPTSATTTSSVFGQSMFGTAAAPPATSNVFGQSSTFGFAQAAGATSPATGTSLFGQAAFGNNASSPSTSVFGGTGFGTTSTPQQSIFGGSSAAAASPGMKPADAFGGGGNAFQSLGLGASPNPANVNKNVFGGGSFGATGQQSLFGSAAAQPSAPFGAPSASASQGFGAFGSPNKPVFGVSASFGGSPAFGAAQVSPVKTFGAVGADSGAGFGNFAAASTLPTFGSLASGQPPQFQGLPAASPQPPAPAPSFGGGTAFSSWR